MAFTPSALFSIEATFDFSWIAAPLLSRLFWTYRTRSGSVPGQQLVHQLHDDHLTTQTLVHAGDLESDVSASHYEHLLRERLQLESLPRADHSVCRRTQAREAESSSNPSRSRRSWPGSLRSRLGPDRDPVRGPVSSATPLMTSTLLPLQSVPMPGLQSGNDTGLPRLECRDVYAQARSRGSRTLPLRAPCRMPSPPR